MNWVDFLLIGTAERYLLSLLILELLNRVRIE